MQCHYVSRFLCKYWSVGKKKKHRLAKYIDQDLDQIKEDEIENIFAITDLNSKEEELKLNQLIETPLARHHHDLIHNVNFKLEDIALLKALRLFTIVQNIRYKSTIGDKSSTKLSEILKLIESSDDEITKWTLEQENQSTIVIMRLAQNDLLFHPARGHFTVPTIFKDKNLAPVAANAFPIHPNVLIGILPLEADIDLMSQLPMSCYSTSNSDNCRKFIISPEICKSHDQAFILDEFHRLQEVAEITYKLMSEMQDIKIQILTTISKVATGQFNQSEIDKFLEEKNKSILEINKHQDDLIKRRSTINPSESRVGQAWTSWNKTV